MWKQDSKNFPPISTFSVLRDYHALPIASVQRATIYHDIYVAREVIFLFRFEQLKIFGTTKWTDRPLNQLIVSNFYHIIIIIMLLENSKPPTTKLKLISLLFYFFNIYPDILKNINIVSYINTDVSFIFDYPKS